MTHILIQQYDCNHDFLWCCDISNLKIKCEVESYKSILMCRHCGYMLKTVLSHKELSKECNFQRINDYIQEEKFYAKRKCRSCGNGFIPHSPDIYKCHSCR